MENCSVYTQYAIAWVSEGVSLVYNAHKDTQTQAKVVSVMIIVAPERITLARGLHIC